VNDILDRYGNVLPIEDTVLAALARAVSHSRDRTFLDFMGEKYSFGEVDVRSTKLANSFRDLGVKQGDTVITLLDNSIDVVVCWFAINKLGAVWVPVNTAYFGAFLRHQIVDAGAKIAVCEAHYLERITSLEAEVPDLQMVLVRGDLPANRVSPRLRSLDDHRGHDDTIIDLPVRHSDVACLIYTSGTTGPSKGCMISHNYLCFFSRTQIESLPPLPDECNWTCLPLFHIAAIGGVVLSALLMQECAAVAARFSVSGFWADIERSGASTATMIGAMFELLANAPDTPEQQRCVGQLRAVTGAPISEEARASWRQRFGVNFINSYCYGQTECTRIGSLSYGLPPAPDASCGLVVDELEVIIADDDDRPLPPNTPGEILVRPKRPYQCFSGYWKQPEATVAAWRNLWLHTGDIGKLDENGYLYFVDRKKDYLRRRGENVSSFETETAILDHPQIADVAVHAVFSEMGEDDIKITCVLRQGEHVVPRDLHEWCKTHLPRFAMPRYIEFRDSLPRNPVGRVLKFQLRDEGITPDTWDAAEALTE
jgi:crotonobetaine/carnitine-CoA ligase